MSGETGSQDWPLDTPDCVFLARAIDQIGKTQFPAEWTGREIFEPEPTEEELQRLVNAREVVAKAIADLTLKMRMRLDVAMGSDLAYVGTKVRTPEGWNEAIKTFELWEVDFRPWISVRQRRRIPQRHWLFVTRASLEKLLSPQSRLVPTEAEALTLIRSKIATGVNFGRREQRPSTKGNAP